VFVFRQKPAFFSERQSAGCWCYSCRETIQLVAEGYRLELVSGYSVAGQGRFAAIWTK